MNKEPEKEVECPRIPKFVPETHKGCKGHADHALDCEYTKKEERNQIIKVLDNYIN